MSFQHELLKFPLRTRLIVWRLVSNARLLAGMLMPEFSEDRTSCFV